MKQTENQSQKIYYTMGEVAEMLDVSQSLLRFWEKEFAEIRPKRNKKGNRLFTEQDLKTLKVIYHLVKERGLKIAAAKRQLKLGEQPISREAAIVEKLNSIRAILMEVKLALDSETATYQTDEPMEAEQLVEVESVVEEVAATEQTVEVAEVEIEAEISATEEAVQQAEAQAEEPEKVEKPKKKTARKPRRPKFAFKEVELFSLDELDAMQPKPGERRGNGEVQQLLFAEE